MLDRTRQPDIKPFVYQGFPNFETAFLENGIEVIYIPFGNIPVLEVQLVIRTGYCYETVNAAAQAAFKLLTDGTNRFSSYELSEVLDSYGSEISTSVGFEQSTITLSTPTKHVHKTIELLSEVYTQANFPSEEWLTYQQRMIKSLEIEEKKTNAMANRLFLKKLWGDYPYGKKATQEDFQTLQWENIYNFHKNEILKNEVYIIVSGNYKVDMLHKLLNQNLGVISLNNSSTLSHSKLKIPQSEQGLHVHYMENQVQSSIKLGHLSVPRNHPDYEALQVLGTLLGGFFGSRLMKNIREEKGFTYGIYGGFVGMKEKGYFVISTDVANEYVDSTLKEIYKEMEILQSEKVEEHELNIVKNYLMGNLLSLLETPFQIADMLALLRLNGLKNTHLEETFYLIKNIDSNKIMELACKYFNTENLVTVVAGSYNY